MLFSSFFLAIIEIIAVILPELRPNAKNVYKDSTDDILLQKQGNQCIFGNVNAVINTEMLIIAIIVFLLLISLGIGIINWVLLAATSSKMSTLEAEIEKKTKEFDAIKKDRQLLQQSTSSETPSQTENPSIEIVRNFRPGFHNSPQDGQSLSVSRVPPSATLEPQLAATSSFPASMDATAQTPWSGEASETIGNTAQRSSEIPYANLAADVLDVVDENAAKEERQSSLDSAITIALFSSAKKDTDFSSAWKQLTAYLPIAPQPRVILDFQNVIFLYDRELQYLEKIRDVILAQGGSLQFVNCHDELRSILSRRPTLAGCIA